MVCKCRRCHLDLQLAEINVVYHMKKSNEGIVLCPSCYRFINGLIASAVDDILEEYILRKE